MASDIPDGYTMVLSRGLVIRPIRRKRVDDLIDALCDVPLNEKARVLRQFARTQIVYGRLPDADEDALYDVLFAYTPAMQAADEKSIKEGMEILRLHPHLMKTTCEQCRKWAYSARTGVTLKGLDGEPLERNPSDIYDRPACDDVLGASGWNCPKGHYNYQKGFTAKTLQAYRHNVQCQIKNDWPEDDIVQYNLDLFLKYGAMPEKKEEAKWVWIGTPTTTTTTYSTGKTYSMGKASLGRTTIKYDSGTTSPGWYYASNDVDS